MDAVKEFKNQIKKEIKISLKEKRKGDMEHIIANNNKIKKYLRWFPKKNNLSRRI